MDFKKVLAAVLGSLGITEMSKNTDGKMTLTAEQKTSMTERWGAKFVEEFSAELAKHEEEGGISATDLAAELSTLKADNEKNTTELTTLRAQLAAADKAKQDADAIIAAMGKTAVEGEGQVVTGANTGNVKIAFKPDMSLAHNQYLFKGAAYSGDTTINTTELQKEFGKYVSSEKTEIILGLIGKTTSVEYMSTIMSDKTEIRAQQAAITSVMQQFTPYWTPKGKTTFTPLTIRNFKHKLNVPIIPSDIMEDILGYLYDENLKPEEMPVVKYILEVLVYPKLEEERELALAVGEYKESSATKDGDAASPATESMDGYITILKKLKSKGNKDITWLLDGITLDDQKLVDQIDLAVAAVKPLYKNKTMFIHADPDLVTRYGKAYRNKYPYTKNEDGEKVKVDFSNFTFVPLDGMRGTNVFFITPKENFKHIISKDPKNTKVWIQGENYAVKIFGEWWEAVGFWLAEAIFAYIPPTVAPIPPKNGI